MISRMSIGILAYIGLCQSAHPNGATQCGCPYGGPSRGDPDTARLGARLHEGNHARGPLRGRVAPTVVHLVGTLTPPYQGREVLFIEGGGAGILGAGEQAAAYTEEVNRMSGRGSLGALAVVVAIAVAGLFVGTLWAYNQLAYNVVSD